MPCDWGGTPLPDHLHGLGVRWVTDELSATERGYQRGLYPHEELATATRHLRLRFEGKEVTRLRGVVRDLHLRDARDSRGPDANRHPAAGPERHLHVGLDRTLGIREGDAVAL